MDVKKAGKLGGNTTKLKYGKDHYSKIASARNKKYWAERKKKNEQTNQQTD